jgi:hypothetical protein
MEMMEQLVKLEKKYSGFSLGGKKSVRQSDYLGLEGPSGDSISLSHHCSLFGEVLRRQEPEKLGQPLFPVPDSQADRVVRGGGEK